MRLCPGLHTLVAIVLNASGRPTSLVFNNVGQLGFAISIAFMLGLNRDPSTWDIPSHEKRLRKNVWRALLICDGWSSLAYGIPPRILNSQTDMPLPSIMILDAPPKPALEERVVAVFCALATLTEVLNDYLQTLHKYRQLGHSPTQLPVLSSLQDWKDSTSGDVRRIVFRGADLKTPGAANLRLLFLSVQFLQHRVCLENQRGSIESTETQALWQSYVTTREAAEEVVLFIQEIGSDQRKDFWLPHTAFLLSYTMSFLLRSALEQEYEVTGPTGRNGALTLATDLMVALRAHADPGGWDLGEVCIAQYSDILATVQAMDNDPNTSSIDCETWNALVSDVSFEDNILFTTMCGIL
ncbi:unnamed protein product [Clonostachys solani]|uniref:Xylanolytic transcriptional activator regulatory domain-containing protein n=1 Tax=Clonostachys solani TaxID=160281 RepID=A0A9N9Z0N4_9HYPO|nr:unnamed protein product [Clonostachys solani]